MPSLRDKMQHHLHQWRDSLPCAWREALDGVEPNLCAIENAELGQDDGIVPAQDRVFYALDGIEPADVRVVVIGNDPYPRPHQATGRSFEQGDLTNWIEDLDRGRVTASLLTLARAAASLCPNAEGLHLDERGLGESEATRRLRSALQYGVGLLPPQSMFECLTGQGVLWLNRTLTISVSPGSRWSWIDDHRELHRELWSPVTCAIISSLVGEALRRPVVFALFGGPAIDFGALIEDKGRCQGVPEGNIRFVQSGHPSTSSTKRLLNDRDRYRSDKFFRWGNPLQQINSELTEPIDWCCPAASPSPTNDSIRTSTLTRRGPARPRTSTPFARLARSYAIMDRVVGKYREALRQLAEQ